MFPSAHVHRQTERDGFRRRVQSDPLQQQRANRTELNMLNAETSTDLDQVQRARSVPRQTDRETAAAGWYDRTSTVSTAQLRAFLPLHLRPINLVVYQGSYVFRLASLISRGASRLDAFSGYPCRT